MEDNNRSIAKDCSRIRNFLRWLFTDSYSRRTYAIFYIFKESPVYPLVAKCKAYSSRNNCWTDYPVCITPYFLVGCIVWSLY